MPNINAQNLRVLWVKQGLEIFIVCNAHELCAPMQDTDLKKIVDDLHILRCTYIVFLVDLQYIICCC